MHLVNITSRLSNLRDLLIDVINIGQIEPVDAFNQVASRAFSVKASTENVELTEDMNSIKSFEGLSKSDIEKITYLKTLLESDDSINDSCKKAISKEDLEDLYKNLAPIIKRKEELLEKRKELLDFKGNLEILDKAEIDIEKIKNLNYFDYRYGEVSKDGRFILKNNYENIPSLIIHLDEDALKSSDALNEIFELDKKTTIRRKEVDDIIANEKEESLKVAMRIDNEYSNKIQDEIIRINSKYDQEIEQKSKEIKEEYKKLRDDIQAVYDEKIDMLVDYAFDIIMKGD